MVPINKGQMTSYLWSVVSYYRPQIGSHLPFVYKQCQMYSCTQRLGLVSGNKSGAKVLIRIILSFLLLHDGWQYYFNVIFVITIGVR